MWLTLGIVSFALLALARPVASQTPASADASALYRTVAPSVFLVEVHDDRDMLVGLGSAFLVAGGRLITNAHVLRDGHPFLRTGAVALPLTVQRLDPEDDLAVLSCETPIDAPPLPLASVDPPVGTVVFALGNPRGLERSISEGLIAGFRDREGRRLLQLTAAISPGSSGGPVVNRAGEVVGVTVGYLEGGQNLNFAIPTTTLRALLARPQGTAGFEAAFAKAQRLAAQNVTGQDTASINWYMKALRASIEQAGSAATTGDELLAVAALAQRQWEFDQAIRFAERALARGVGDADSARTVFLGAWSFQIIFSGDTLSTSTLQHILAVADTVALHRAQRASTQTLRATVLGRLHRGPEAFAAARRGVTLNPAEPGIGYRWTVYHRIAATYGTVSDDDSVFAEMVQARQATASDWEAHATHLEARKEWNRAGDAYADAFRSASSGRARYACEAGKDYWIGARLDAALDAFRTCLQMYAVASHIDTAEVVMAHRGMADILVGRGVYGQAESHARQARVLDPTDAWAAYELARALRAAQRPTEAAAAAEEAIRLSDGRIANMHFEAGAAYFDLQDWGRCEQAFRKAYELNPREVAAAYNLGLCLARQGYYRDAARWMETVLRQDPHRTDREDIEAMIRAWRR